MQKVTSVDGEDGVLEGNSGSFVRICTSLKNWTWNYFSGCAYRQYTLRIFTSWFTRKNTSRGLKTHEYWIHSTTNKRSFISKKTYGKLIRRRAMQMKKAVILIERRQSDERLTMYTKDENWLQNVLHNTAINCIRESRATDLDSRTGWNCVVCCKRNRKEKGSTTA